MIGSSSCVLLVSLLLADSAQSFIVTPRWKNMRKKATRWSTPESDDDNLTSLRAPEQSKEEHASLLSTLPTTTDNNVVAPSLPSSSSPACIIKVIGVGGAGGNAVNHMIQTKIDDSVAFFSVNTDAQALAKSLTPNVLNIGRKSTRGLGAGGDPATGKTAAQESVKDLQTICQGADMIFLTAGMGGGTGSGAAPVLAKIAKTECGCLTVGVVTKPFVFEGKRRMRQAEEAIEALRQNVDTLIVVSNDKLLQMVPENTPMTQAFLAADDILRQGVIGIVEIIQQTGLVNVDFADVRAVMKNAGRALMGIGTGSGNSRAADAAKAAISSQLLDSPIHKAKRVVFNIVGGSDLGLGEINEASEVIYENCSEDANIIFGALINPEMGDSVSITVLACDFDEDEKATEEDVSSVRQQSVVSEQQNPDPVSGSVLNGSRAVLVSDSDEERPVESQPSDVIRGSQLLSIEPRIAMKRGFKGPVDPAKKRTSGLFRKLRRD